MDYRPRLDWHPPDKLRSFSNLPYRVARQDADFNLEKPLRSKQWSRKAWLDQGVEGACTGFGAAHCMSIGYRRWPVSNEIARGFYLGAQRFDQWAGEDYIGSSVLGAMSYLKSINYVNEYWWCLTPDELTHAVTQFGAIEVGTYWTTGMFTPDSSGKIHPTGRVEGGHAYCVAGIDLKRRLARVDNSWGGSWGVKGSAFIDLDDLFSLIFERNGEAALPRKNIYRA